jgi:hypothetical protein
MQGDGVETIWLALGAKMVTTAAIVVVTCLVVERAGPLVGAMVATLPVSAGPAYAFLAIEHGAGFIAASAPASLASLIASAGFAVAYGALARTRGRLLSTAAALAVWLVMVTALRRFTPGLGAAMLVAAVVFPAGFWIVAPWRHAPVSGHTAASRWDIPIRAGAAMLLVGATIVASQFLGPAAAGELALAPVVMTSLAVLLYPRIGGPAAAAMMANTMPGLLAMALASMELGLAAVPLGATISLLVGLAICIGLNGGVVLVAWARRR